MHIVNTDCDETNIQAMSVNVRLTYLRRLLGIDDGVDSAFVRVTPSMAQELLKFNVGNRTLRKKAVKSYSDVMRLGEWSKSGDAITISPKGYLNNGQHRLSAIVSSNTTCEMLIAFDVESGLHTDTGVKRSFSDNAAISDTCVESLKYNRALHTMVTTMLTFCTGVSNTEKVPDSIKVQILNHFEREFVEFCNYGLEKQPKGRLSKDAFSTALTASWFIAYMNGVPLDTLTHIKSILISGEMQSEFDKPILALRDELKLIHGGGINESLLRAGYSMDCIKRLLSKSKARKVDNKGVIYTYDFINPIISKYFNK